MQKRKTPNSAFLFLAESKGVFAFDTLSWRNVETVHRTVSLSLLSSLCSEFAPIFGSNPLVEINKKRKVAPWGYHFLFWRRARDSNPRNEVNRLHDFQSCSFDHLGQLSISFNLLCYYTKLITKNQVPFYLICLIEFYAICGI